MTMAGIRWTAAQRRKLIEQRRDPEFFTREIDYQIRQRRMQIYAMLDEWILFSNVFGVRPRTRMEDAIDRYLYRRDVATWENEGGR